MNPMEFRVSISLGILNCSRVHFNLGFTKKYILNYNNGNAIHLTRMPLELQRLKIHFNLGFTKKCSKRRNDMDLMDENLGIGGEYLRK